MITLYLRDNQNIYSGSGEYDPMGAVPARSTTVEPPALTGSEVARWNGSGWDVLPERPAVPVQSAIDQARASAHSRIDDAYTAQTNQLSEGYPENEQKSWPVQIMEADTVLAGGTAPTPWIDAASAARGVTKQEMANLIKAQDTAYRTYHGQLSGVRQALRDQINAIPDGQRSSIDVLNSIEWPTQTET